MTNTTTGGSRRSRVALLALVAAAGCVAALAVFPGGASASTVTCNGKMLTTPDPTVDNQLSYQFTCNEKILSYSVIANRSVNYFDPEVEVFIQRPEKNNVSPTESFGCEGPIPGNGIGCKGSASNPDDLGSRWIDGSIGTEQNACAKHAKGNGFKAWVVVTTQEADATGKPFLISSEPFRLYGPGCKAAGAGGRHPHHRLRT